jgi:hypothetical protein
MTLWAVRVYQPEGTWSSYFASPSRDEADESAYRINDFMASLNGKHGEVIVMNVVAEVIEWPDDPDDHELQLTELQMKEEEWDSLSDAPSPSSPSSSPSEQLF